MGSAGTKHRVEEVGGPIEHLWMAAESRGAMDIAFHAYQTTDSIHIPVGGRLELGQGVERALSGRLVSLLDREFGSQPTRVRHHAVAPGQLPRSEHQIARAHPRLVGGHRARGWRHHDSQVFQGLGDSHRVAHALDAVPRLRPPTPPEPSLRRPWRPRNSATSPAE